MGHCEGQDFHDTYLRDNAHCQKNRSVAGLGMTREGDACSKEILERDYAIYRRGGSRIAPHALSGSSYGDTTDSGTGETRLYRGEISSETNGRERARECSMISPSFATRSSFRMLTLRTSMSTSRICISRASGSLLFQLGRHWVNRMPWYSKLLITDSGFHSSACPCRVIPRINA